MSSKASQLKTLYENLNKELSKSANHGKEYIDAIEQDGIKIFDVRQPSNDFPLEDFSEREQVESLFFSLPDYLYRDRIYTKLQYLHVHIYDMEISQDELYEKVKDEAARISSRILQKEIGFKKGSKHPDLIEIFTNWAYENRVGKAEPEEEELASVSIKVHGNNYLFVKLLKDRKRKKNRLVFTSWMDDLLEFQQLSLKFLESFDC